MNQLSLLAWEPKGSTYNAQRDLARLSDQMRRVYDALSTGRKFTLRELADAADCPEASASARFRDLKRLGFAVDKKNLGAGTWQYFMHPPPRPTA